MWVFGSMVATSGRECDHMANCDTQQSVAMVTAIVSEPLLKHSLTTCVFHHLLPGMRSPDLLPERQERVPPLIQEVPAAANHIHPSIRRWRRLLR